MCRKRNNFMCSLLDTFTGFNSLNVFQRNLDIALDTDSCHLQKGVMILTFLISVPFIPFSFLIVLT